MPLNGKDKLKCFVKALKESEDRIPKKDKDGNMDVNEVTKWMSFLQDKYAKLVDDKIKEVLESDKKVVWCNGGLAYKE